MKAEVDLLHRDVDHYKVKLQREKKSRQCSCRDRIVENKEVQCVIELEPMENDQNGVVSNGESSAVQHPNIYNLDSDLQVYYVRTVPYKYREANQKIMELEATNKEIQKKSNFYKELALSRRADVKRLQEELDKAAAPVSSTSSTDAKP